MTDKTTVLSIKAHAEGLARKDDERYIGRTQRLLKGITDGEAVFRQATTHMSPYYFTSIVIRGEPERAIERTEVILRARAEMVEGISGMIRGIEAFRGSYTPNAPRTPISTVRGRVRTFMVSVRPELEVMEGELRSLRDDLTRSFHEPLTSKEPRRVHLSDAEVIERAKNIRDILFDAYHRKAGDLSEALLGSRMG